MQSLPRASILGILIALGLVLLGWALIPATNPVSVAGACAVLVVYGAAFYFVLPRVSPDVAKWARLFGLLAGGVFAAEILLEYALLPKDNTSWGIAEFGIVFALYFFASFWAAYRRHRLGTGVLTAVLSAMVSSLLWLIAVLAAFYLFRGTERQVQVFTAEGNYQDFTASGMANFDAWTMEDFLGAAFFHSMLGPAIAAFLGLIGGAIGRLVGRATESSFVHG
jgi:hypothetical protein